MMHPGPRNAITDVPGLRVGNASDARLKSGVTVLTGDAPFVAGVDIRGGAPGTRETDLLEPGRLVPGVDALVLSGGSAFGLDAASGVVDRLRALGRGYRAAAVVVPIVPAAILFDLANGGEKGWAENPYPALGAAAFDAAAEDFAIGSVGAGTGAMTATLMGGLGSASIVTEHGVTVGALAAVNAFGSVCVPGGRSFWAGALEIGDELGGLGPAGARVAAFTPRHMKPGPADPMANTTIAIVATDAALDKAGARRLAEAAHGGLARAVYPAHTPFDGDLVFGVSTGRLPAGDAPGHEAMVLGHAAAHCLARAIARAVFAARPAAGNLLPCWCETGGAGQA
jgi:D-aminopeptidase